MFKNEHKHAVAPRQGGMLALAVFLCLAKASRQLKAQARCPRRLTGMLASLGYTKQFFTSKKSIMITLSKLKEYEDYGGYYDGFYMQKVQKGSNITTDKDWSLIKRLIHDAWLAGKELASAEFIEKFNKELFQSCDTEETRGQLKLLAQNGVF